MHFYNSLARSQKHKMCPSFSSLAQDSWFVSLMDSGRESILKVGRERRGKESRGQRGHSGLLWCVGHRRGGARSGGNKLPQMRVTVGLWRAWSCLLFCVYGYLGFISISQTPTIKLKSTLKVEVCCGDCRRINLILLTPL